MHAHSPDIAVVATVDDGKRVGREVVAEKVIGGSGQLVLLFAGAVTSAATDTARAVEQQRLLSYCLRVHFFTWEGLSYCRNQQLPFRRS